MYDIIDGNFVIFELIFSNRSIKLFRIVLSSPDMLWTDKVRTKASVFSIILFIGYTYSS